MLTNRIIACLDVMDGRVVKGTGFVNLRDAGDPVVLAERYEAQGADEIVYLDIAATDEGRGTLLDLVRRTAERLFIPLTVGGGMRTVDDIANALRAGADKTAVNSAAVRHPNLLTHAASRFGSQCVVASIDALRRGESWEVYINGGRQPTGLDAIEWAQRCAELGAGEILLTSIDRDGARSGYDIELLSAVAAVVTVPVVASGGAGSARDVVDAFVRGGADAALLAGVLHDATTDIRSLKSALQAASIPVRTAA
ncbi:MAG TPA: imidazole glycerol phosphate synthase subunit HisF [Gemmatimonadetes bacterium]|jgi:cyclase|nr:imidazole glycerol phosphate synthase subunit HisF [Gemmatimonadota bacterium]